MVIVLGLWFGWCDLRVLSQPYMNGGSPNYSWEMPTMKTAVYIDGPLNNPLIPGTRTCVHIVLLYMSTLNYR